MAITILTGLNGTYKFSPDSNSNILGKGGMGIVYKGLDQNDRPVAIKVMHRAISVYVNNIEQAKREAAIQIKHRNLIRMLDFIEKDGDYYIVSEFIDGETLRHKLDKFPQGFDQQLCIDITINALEGLATLHSYNVVHRDIDPSNIMICKDGTVKLMDFGIAKISGYDLQTLTGTGAFKGKLQYAAPEQIKGEKNKIDNTTDIYSIGITFYEMLTGVMPFNGESEFDLMKKHIEDPLPTNSKISKNLFGLIIKATAKNQNDRYKTATEFLEDLGHEKPLKNADEYFERAERFRKSENWVKAIENYDIVIDKSKDYPNAHFWKAWCNAEIGQFIETIAEYTYVIKNSPNESSAYNNRALAFAKIGKIDEAIEDYKQAILRDPNVELYKINYVAFLESNNLHQQLIDNITEEIKVDSKNPELYLQRAFAELELKHESNFKADLKIAKRLKSKGASLILKAPIIKVLNLIGIILWFPCLVIPILAQILILLFIFHHDHIFKTTNLFPYDGILSVVLSLILFVFGLFNLFMSTDYLKRKFESLLNSSFVDINDEKLKKTVENYVRKKIKGWGLIEQYVVIGYVSFLLPVYIAIGYVIKWI